MSRQYVVFGECMVSVKGSANDPEETADELGLTQDAIRIIKKVHHHPVYVDDFGDQVPGELLFNMAEASVRMLLVHYDQVILDLCIAQAMATPLADTGLGVCGPVGFPLMAKGRGLRLNIEPLNDLPWRFFQSFLAADPLEIPIGTQRTLVDLQWRSLPLSTHSTAFEEGKGYFGDILSRDAVIWDRGLDD